MKAKNEALQARALFASQLDVKKAVKIIDLEKSMVTEGDFVLVSCEDEVHVGIVEYVMTNGMLGRVGAEYSIEATLLNPAVLVRTLEFEDDEGIWEETEYLIGAESEMVTKIQPLPLEAETVVMDSEVAMAMYDSQMGKKDYSTATREQMAVEHTAMPDGSFPIANGADLRNAIQSVGRAKDYNAAKQHIIHRARALGMINELPEDWKNKVKKTEWGGSVFDLNPFVK